MLTGIYSHHIAQYSFIFHTISSLHSTFPLRFKLFVVIVVADDTFYTEESLSHEKEYHQNLHLYQEHFLNLLATHLFILTNFTLILDFIHSYSNTILKHSYNASQLNRMKRTTSHKPSTTIITNCISIFNSTITKAKE